MAGITAQGTTFNLPNFVGELFLITPSDTPLLSAIGGLTGGESVQAKLFEWEFYDLRSPDGERQALEGANAPTPEARVRAYAHNVLEIHQEAVEVSYTKQAAIGQLDVAVLAQGSNPVTDEMAFQVSASLKQIARDIEVSFLTGQIEEPTDNNTPRETQGLIAAIATNVTDLSAADLTVDAVLDTMQKAWESGGLMEGETRTAIVNATLKRALTTLFIKDQNFRQQDRNVGGVNVTSIETDFGDLNIMLNRYMPVDVMVFASLEDLAPVFLMIPGKGFLFVEPLAKNGSADRSQIYGEVGLKFGNERKHAKIINASGSIS
jgi:hypothetical protein